MSYYVIFDPVKCEVRHSPNKANPYSVVSLHDENRVEFVIYTTRARADAIAAAFKDAQEDVQ